MRKNRMLGFLGFMGFEGIRGIINGGGWTQAIWIVWFVWFVYFIPVKKIDEIIFSFKKMSNGELFSLRFIQNTKY